VIAPDAFLTELARLYEAGVRFDGRLFVSQRAHVLLPCHAVLDRAREEAQGQGRIGTTSRGIGPAYESKASRYGVRMCDLFAPDLEDRLRFQLSRVQVELASLGNKESLPSPAAYADQCRQWAEKLRPSLRDTEQLLNAWIAEGKSLLFEGAQGALLDIDHGTYPFVTSSNSTAGGACTGTGVPPTRIDGAIGVLKAYTTRVGGGPFPSELSGNVADFLRRRGNEFGKIPVCVGYRIQGEVVRDFPPDRRSLETAEPVLRTFKGWKRSTVGILEEGGLPQEARDYIRFIEDEVGAQVSLVSTGPRREETLVHEHPALTRLTSGRLGKVIENR
jgi:adenylosuccinate synthase